MSLTRKLAQAGVLCDFLGAELSELIKHSTQVYSWRDNYYEVVGDKTARAQHKSGGTPISHYIKYRYANKDWRIRELGKKSLIYQKYKL